MRRCCLLAVVSCAGRVRAAEDVNPSCVDWASQGECERNAAYMNQECEASCKARLTANCLHWAEQGECEENPAFMKEQCMQTCLELPQVAEVDEEPEDPALNHPGGPRCYYDALAHGCPSSISIDGRALLCSCLYEDNSWFHVWTKFVAAFATRSIDRSTLAQFFDARIESDGIVTLEVGLRERLQCGAVVSNAYPGTNSEVHTEELYRMLGSFIYPEVRNKFFEICLPGRLALQLICQHVFIHGMKDLNAAKLYAVKANEVFSMVDSCVEDQTPWTFPGMKNFLRAWQKDDLPPRSKLAWYPDPSFMRAKTPAEAAERNYAPCLPIDPHCFPSGSQSDFSSCETCCNPHFGPQGNAQCFGGQFTFARCCRTPGNSGRFW